MSRRSLSISWVAVAAVSFLGCLGAAAQPKPEPLRLERRIELPTMGSIPTDIRWASEHSVYVSWFKDGVAEIDLESKQRRLVVPHLARLDLRMYNYYNLASSPRLLTVAASGMGMAWRPLKAGPGGAFEFRFQRVPVASDVDLLGDRILLLGTPLLDREKRNNGAVVWLGKLADTVEELKPVLSAREAAKSLMTCQMPAVGAVRFFADGSFVVAPGFIDGVYLFDSAGRQVRSWSNEQIGVDTHKTCPEMTEEDEVALADDPQAGGRWLQRHQVIEDVLPLPQGPGVLVRSWGRDRAVRWTLKVLRPEGVATYSVPIVSRRPFDRLRADVRNGRIAVLLSNAGMLASTAPSDLSSEVLLFEIPR